MSQKHYSGALACTRTRLRPRGSEGSRELGILERTDMIAKCRPHRAALQQGLSVRFKLGCGRQARGKLLFLLLQLCSSAARCLVRHDDMRCDEEDMRDGCEVEL